MKRKLALLLALITLLTMTGCEKEEARHRDFYYLRTTDTIAYGEIDALIVPVSREVPSGTADLSFLLQQYMDAPMAEGLRSPYPKGIYVLSTISESDTLKIVLSREFSQLENIHLTLAGACLTATCHSLTGRTRIQIISNGQTYDFSMDNFTFWDDSAAQ